MYSVELLNLLSGTEKKRFMTVLVSFLLQAFQELTPKHPLSDLPDQTSLHVFKGDIQPTTKSGLGNSCSMRQPTT